MRQHAQAGLARYDGESFKTWQNEPFNENSLSADLIQTLFLDRGDILWAGTYNGLNRFDPSTGTFTIYRNAPNRPTSISNDLVIAIERDSRGRLWVGTANGLNRLDEATGDFTRFLRVPGDPRSLPNNTVRSLLCDRAGRLWVGTSGGGFARFDENRGDFTVLAGSPEKAPPSAGEVPGPPPCQSLMSIKEDGEGNLWLGAWGTGLLRWSPATGASRVYSLPDNRVYVVNAAREGKVRAGTWGGGLYILDRASASIAAYRYSKALGVLPHDVVYSMLEDASGEFWIGTNGGGVARMDRGRDSYTAWVADPDNPGALPNGKIQAILVDSRKDLWVSVYSGGLHRLDRTRGVWEHFRHLPGDPDGLADDTSNALYEDREGQLWAGSNGGLCLFDREARRFRTIPSFGGVRSNEVDIVYAVLEDGLRSGVYWIGTYTKGLYRWDRPRGEWTHYPHDPSNLASLSDNLINTLAWDQRGRLWVGTNNGLNRLEDGKFVRYTYDSKNRMGLSSSAITRVFIDTQGGFWVATRGGGLCRFDESRGEFSHLTRNEGLPSNMVTALLEDGSGDLWIVTQDGLARRDRATGALKRVRLYKELDNATFNAGACIGNDGKVYFGSVGMVTSFDPSSYEANAHKPPVFITEFVAANREKLGAPISALPRALALDSWENSLEFRFAALDYRDPGQNTFAWRLEGFDRDWTLSSSRRFASYTNLPGGTYTFRVRASNNDGAWNEVGASLPFTIARPAWLSLPAIALYLLFIAFVGYSIATLRSNRILAGKVRELTETKGALEVAKDRATGLAVEAEKATAAKSAFIAIVSHEIRNSLNGIIGVAELLARDQLTKRQAEELAVIQQSGDVLLALVNDILDLSKAEADRIELENLAWSPRELVERTRAFYESPAATKGLEFGARVGESVPETVGGDPVRVQQLVMNLLSNAFKFTERGGIRFTVDIEGGAPTQGSADRSDPAEWLRFRVSDSGSGIEASKLDTIFEPFTQESASTSRLHGGTGLGLSIVRRLVDRMGGDIQVESKVGIGTTFTVSLPLLPAPAAGADVTSTEEKSARGLRVLVVDDDPVNRRIATQLVAWLGGIAGQAESGELALAALASGAWNLALLDENMPGLSGMETARRIREEEAREGRPAVTLLAMTAHIDHETQAHCEDAGMDGFVAKPLTISSLGAALAKVEGPKEVERRIPRGSPLFAEGYFAERYSGDPTFGVEILELWLSTAPALLDEALRAAREDRWTDARNSLHRLFGSTAIVTEGFALQELRDLEGSALAAINGGLGRTDLAGRIDDFRPVFAELRAEVEAKVVALKATTKDPGGAA